MRDVATQPCDIGRREHLGPAADKLGLGLDVEGSIAMEIDPQGKGHSARGELMITGHDATLEAPHDGLHGRVRSGVHRGVETFRLVEASTPGGLQLHRQGPGSLRPRTLETGRRVECERRLGRLVARHQMKIENAPAWLAQGQPLALHPTRHGNVLQRR